MASQAKLLEHMVSEFSLKGDQGRNTSNRSYDTKKKDEKASDDMKFDFSEIDFGKY